MLRAVNPERNVNRSWVCRIERDLFGACVVSVTFGRAGTHGRTIRRMVSGVTTRKCTLRTLRVNPTRTLRLFC
ncbi:WGR domain-containing protein [Acetobacter oeni]